MGALILTILFTLAIPVAMAQQLAGSTQMVSDGRHGTQIEYLTDGGEAYLWYPDNSNILAGRWKREGQAICFAYGENTFNPATDIRVAGGNACPSTAPGGWSRSQAVGREDRTRRPSKAAP